jgi:hypothetical protein
MRIEFVENLSIRIQPISGQAHLGLLESKAMYLFAVG